MEQKIIIIIIIIKILHQMNVVAIVFLFFFLLSGINYWHALKYFFNVKVPECQFRSAGVVLKCFRGV